MSAVSFEAFGDLAASNLSHTEKAGRYAFQAEAESAVVDDIAAKLWLSPADSLLDIGCGTGNLLIPLSFRVRSAAGVDHEKVIGVLQRRHPEIKTHAGNFLSVSIAGKFDKILIYSVLHYLTDEFEVCRFLRKALKLLRPGGRLLAGDIPNADRKRRFMESDFGRAFNEKWAAQGNGGNEFFEAINADKKMVEFNDEMIKRTINRLGLRACDYSIRTQPVNLPFGHTREDILIVKHR